jgi:hypothetical protein
LLKFSIFNQPPPPSGYSSLKKEERIEAHKLGKTGNLNGWYFVQDEYFLPPDKIFG